ETRVRLARQTYSPRGSDRKTLRLRRSDNCRGRSEFAKIRCRLRHENCTTKPRGIQGIHVIFSTMSARKVVGLDLGTTFSAVAHIDNYGKPQIIPNSETERITPSVIFFDGSNVIVGTVAKNNAVAEPEKIVDFVKREMGKPKDQFHREFDGKIYSAEELSALILKKLKGDAEKYLGQPVTDAVITVPAYFNDAERTATITAGQLAGFNVLQLINEPTAAALAYGLDKLEQEQTVFVFDL